MLKIALVLVKIYVLVGKKGISEFLHWVAQKHTALILLGIYSTLFLQSKKTILQITRSDETLPHFKVKQLFQKFFICFDCDRMEKSGLSLQ